MVRKLQERIKMVLHTCAAAERWGASLTHQPTLWADSAKASKNGRVHATASAAVEAAAA